MPGNIMPSILKELIKFGICRKQRNILLQINQLSVKLANLASCLSSKAVIVFNTLVPSKETLFPEKLKKVNKMLRNVKWMN
jgi:hypothetical protein